MIVNRAATVLAALAALSGGCALGSERSTHGASAAATHDTLEIVRLETYRGHGIAFTYPASWRYRHRGFSSTMTSPVVDLAAQPTRNPCTRRGCWFPVRHLRPGAVVVMWEQAGGLIVPSRRPGPGVRVHIVAHGCRALGGGEELTARVVLGKGRVYESLACFRGPDVAAHEREVRAMLASARRAGPS